MRTPIITLALLSLLTLAGCAAQGTASFPPVPPPVAETMPKPPISPDRQIWQPGHWDWTGSNYAWNGGRWVLSAGHGSEWQNGYWSLVGRHYVWVPAHWL